MLARLSNDDMCRRHTLSSTTLLASETQLSAVAAYVFGNASYSAAHDKLVSTAKPATSVGVSPLPYAGGSANIYPPPATPRTEIASAPPAPGLVESSKFKRPEGWL